jgi:hypothetical protein
MMYVRKQTGYTIHYDGDRIILSGTAQSIHVEAERILRRFANSARPYEIKVDTLDRIVLTAIH